MGHDRTQPVDPHGAVTEESRSVSHTLGPWEIEYAADWMTICGRDPYFPKESEFGQPHVAFICERVQKEANAALIAAAPDMLEALQGVIAWYDSLGHYGANAEKDPPQIAAARAAIAKAEGES